MTELLKETAENVTDFEITNQTDDRPKRKPSDSFYNHFTSLLRVKSNVSDLCNLKTNLKLPTILQRHENDLSPIN